MKDLKTQKKELKVYSIINYISIGLFILSLILLIGGKDTIKTIGAILLIISIPTILIFKKIVKRRKETIKQIEIIKIGNESSKKDN